MERGKLEGKARGIVSRAFLVEMLRGEMQTILYIRSTNILIQI